MQTRPAWVEVSLPTLVSNYHTIKHHLGAQVQLMAVVKANAYGHGAVRCARALETAGADWFAVALVEEGIELRRAGITRPIFLLGGFWQGQADEVIAHDLTPSVFREEAAAELNTKARAAGRTISFHLKVDTGVGRLGIQMHEVAAFAESLRQYSHLSFDGLWTHFAEADAADPAFTETQITKYEEALRIVQSLGFSPACQHLANSPGIHSHPHGWRTMARAGAAMYGLRRDVLAPLPAPPQGLYAVRPVMSLHSRIILLKTVPAGTSLGYGRTFITQRESRIATIAIGYADGLRRAHSNNGRLIVASQQGSCFAPIVGRISMDLTLLDVTDVPGVALGDEVILLGTSDGLEITAEDVAAQIGTISYEVVTGISARVPRVYVPADSQIS
jgi:alanine racemase